ncbi:MAG: NADPH-dependent glutamate synthase [Chloroflexi bacterium]|nr:NADPH-dependent glutamate synthase [Chloroflexota bacterium]
MAKLNLNRQPMPEQDHKERARNFKEVTLGYSLETALAEAERCIICPKPACVKGCPVNVPIPDFIKALRENDLPGAAKALKSKNNLPSICGRVCPQESQCEALCVVGKKGAPIAIGRLERYVGDWELRRMEENPSVPAKPTPTGKRVAVVGAGPSGLTAAADLARLGHSVTIFEALHKPGGVLIYGIPEFRLPKSIVGAEVDYVRSLGVEIVVDSVIGRTVTVDELLDEEGFDVVFLGTGAGLPNFMGIPGENLNGVYSANEFLTRANLMKAYAFPEADTPIKRSKRVAVVGGGNVAMDAVRTALRLGAEEASIVYRRSEEELPARREEFEHAKDEGIVFRFLTNPVEILGDKGWVVGMKCLEMELGEPDASGRRRPVIKPGSEFVLDVDAVIMAIGTSPNPLVTRTTRGLELNRHGTVVADPETGKSSKDKVWAGGDIVTGAATVISAMGAGKRAALSIHEFLMMEPRINADRSG